jgi:hypothetical protein
MKVLFTRSPEGGTWAVRAVQIASMRDDWQAKSVLEITKRELAAFDLVVLVKRPAPQLLEMVRAVGVPLIYDIIDIWPQDMPFQRPVKDSVDFIWQVVQYIQPNGLIFATRQMMLDIIGDGVPGCATIYHHSRHGQAKNPIRPKVKNVGYEGEARFLGDWLPFMEQTCARRAWRFVVNPSSIAELDIAIAMRGFPHDGETEARWKSNIKLANLIDTGTPCVLASESGYMETAPVGFDSYAGSFAEMDARLDALTPLAARQSMSQSLKSVAGSFTLEKIADDYEAYFTDFLSQTRRIISCRP